MKQHLFRLLLSEFTPFWTGKKRFEVLKDDRHFRVGDTVLFREVDSLGLKTGRYVKATISYKLRVGSVGLDYEYCAIGFAEGVSGYDCTKENLENESET